MNIEQEKPTVVEFFAEHYFLPVRGAVKPTRSNLEDDYLTAKERFDSEHPFKFTHTYHGFMRQYYGRHNRKRIQKREENK